MLVWLAGATKDWDKSARVARAFQIGPKEAAAVRNLLNKVAAPTREALQTAVRVRGMKPFLQHDVIGRDCFNVGWSSGMLPDFEAWKSQLTNGDDLELVS